MPTSFIDFPVRLRSYPDIRAMSATSALASVQDAVDLLPVEPPETTIQIPTIGVSGTVPPAADTVVSASVSSDEWNKIGDLTSLIPVSGIKKLDKAVSTLNKLIKSLDPILKLIELYMSTFGSFSKILQSMVNAVEKSLNQFSDNTLSTGVYLNVIVPPAFMPNANTVTNQLSSGGFQGFLERLRISLSDNSDPNRPKFGNDAQVGGFVIMCDSESLDEFYNGLRQLSKTFDFMKLFPLNLEPQPPVNLRGYSGKFKDSKGEEKFGVKIEWDGPPAPPTVYSISRSYVSGGEEKFVKEAPEDLSGKTGLLATIGRMIKSVKLGKSADWPEALKKVYADEAFQGPHLVVSSINGGSYIDFNIPEVDGAPLAKEYYYVVQSVALPNIKGPYSNELRVQIKKCDDTPNMVTVVDNNGKFEMIGPGIGSVGRWSTIRVDGMIPFVPSIVALVQDFLNTLKGKFTDASDSFSSFIDRIKATVLMYADILKVIAMMLTELKKFIMGPSISWIWLDEAKGGNNGFVDRLSTANPPEGVTFSGPSGFTMGIVFMVGWSASAPDANEMKKQSEALKQAFTLISKMFGK